MNRLLFSTLAFTIMLVLSIGISTGELYSRSSLYFRSKCSDIYTNSSCTLAGCYWWDDSCHPYQQFISGGVSEGKYCIDLDKETQFCIFSNAYYIIIDGVVLNV